MKLPSIFDLMCSALWAFMVALIIACLCVGCAPQRAITEAHTSTRVDTIVQYRDRVQTDTLVQYRDQVDSTYVAHYQYQRGDTIFKTDTICQYRVKYEDKWRTRYEYLHDSVYVHDSITMRDSIPYEVQVVKEVRKRNGYDRFTSAGFWILALLLALCVAVRVYLRMR